MSDIYQQITQICTQLITENNVKTVLDYGCGKGHLLELLQSKNPDVQFFGTDYFRKYDIKLVNNNSIQFIDREDIDNSFSNHSFDLIVSTFALHHFQYPVSELQKIYAFLTNNGHFIMFDHQIVLDSHAKIVKTVSSLIGEIEGCLKKSYHRHHYTIEEAKDLFKAIPVNIEAVVELKDQISTEEMLEDQQEKLERNRKIQQMVSQNSSDFMKSIWLPLYQLEEKLIESYQIDFTDVFYILAKKTSK